MKIRLYKPCRKVKMSCRNERGNCIKIDHHHCYSCDRLLEPDEHGKYFYVCPRHLYWERYRLQHDISLKLMTEGKYKGQLCWVKGS